MHVLGKEIDAWPRLEMNRTDEVGDVCLTVPAAHWEDPGQMPNRAFDIGCLQPQFFSEFASQRLFRRFARIDSAAGTCPEATRNIQTFPMEVNQQEVVFLVEDETPNRLPDPILSHGSDQTTGRRSGDANLARVRTCRRW